MNPPKVLTFSHCRSQLEPMVELLNRLYFRRRVEGLSIIYGPEWDTQPPLQWVTRYFREYALDEPDQLNFEWIDQCAHRVLVEERPDSIVLPHLRAPFAGIARRAKARGIKIVVWADQEILSAEQLELLAGYSNQVQVRDQAGQSLGTPSRTGFSLQQAVDFLESARRSSEIRLTISHEPKANLGLLAGSHEPGQELARLWSSLQEGDTSKLVWSENINQPFTNGPGTFRYRDYDNEFALGPAKYDLHKLLTDHVPAKHWRVQVTPSNLEGSNSNSRPNEVLHESSWGETLHHRLWQFQVEVSRTPLADAPKWLDRFSLSPTKKLKIVFVDSRNVAGSLMNHTLTVNRYTEHEALGLSAERHPFIRYDQPECKMAYIDQQRFSPEVEKYLEQADAFVFFDEDDELNPKWPETFRHHVWGKKVLHLYVGWKVHQNLKKNQRAGRTVITPLPHINRMYPNAQFYAGFPPATLDDMALKPPRSTTDGQLRVLHTPSLPHETLSRYIYHKDTEAFIAASRQLKPQMPHCQFWQLGGVSHGAVLAARQDCDITFNHLRGYISLTGDEALYLERVLVHAFDQYSINRHREFWGLDIQFPWVTATPQNLADTLQGLLEDPQRRVQLGQEGRRFMLEYFSPQTGIQPLLYYIANATIASPPPEVR